MNKQQLTDQHSFWNDAVFRLKSFVLTGKRSLRNLKAPPRKFNINKNLIQQPVIAFSESNLWNPFDNKENWILTAGKVENLRIAAKKLNGLEIKAHEIFSFWRHVGKPTRQKGYVVGREIKEGCIVPTVAGGLCQLSNALYDAALNAHFDIVERHKHTKVIKGSLAEKDRDATVKWNYIDLRFRSNFDFRIETELTSEKLIVRFRSQQKNIPSSISEFRTKPFDQLNDCFSCGNFACFKHPDRSAEKQETATTTFVLDERWEEFDAYIDEIATDKDRFVIPLKKNSLIKAERYAWKAIRQQRTTATTAEGVYRALKLRYKSRNQNPFALNLHLDKKIAKAAAQQIPVEATHLVISQNLLPFLYESGVLGGRTFDVLMTRLPMEKLHERLDFAHAQHTESPTLNDFRASSSLISTENKALTQARKIITPHSEIAEIFKYKVEALNWKIPTLKNEKTTGNKILFPASAVGRKGAYEIKRLAQELNLELTIAGKSTESPHFWDEVKIQKFSGNFQEVALVVYPTYVEHQPREILKAIAHQIPIITTKACGIAPSEKVKIIEMGNFQQLKSEVLPYIM